MKLPGRKVLTPYLNATEHASRFGFNQALTEVEALNPQPLAGGEPEVLAYLVQDARDGSFSAHRRDPRGWAHGYPVKELIDRAAYTALQARVVDLEAEVAKLERFEIAYKEWSDKTDWVQKSARPKELGMHRADVMAQRIEALEMALRKVATRDFSKAGLRMVAKQALDGVQP